MRICASRRLATLLGRGVCAQRKTTLAHALVHRLGGNHDCAVHSFSSGEHAFMARNLRRYLADDAGLTVDGRDCHHAQYVAAYGLVHDRIHHRTCVCLCRCRLSDLRHAHRRSYLGQSSAADPLPQTANQPITNECAVLVGDSLIARIHNRGGYFAVAQ